MNASRPEADSEYSSTQKAAPGPRGQRTEDPEARWQRRFEAYRSSVLALSLLGALLLVVAEFTPLLHVHASGRVHVVDSVTSGSHHSYALLPVAVLAAGLAVTVWRSGSRLGLLATAVLGLVAIAIALLGDLPDAHSTGLVGTPSTGLSTASSSPAIGLYLETAGGAALLLSAAAGMLLEPVLDLRPGRPAAARASSSRSAS